MDPRTLRPGTQAPPRASDATGAVPTEALASVWVDFALARSNAARLLLRHRIDPPPAAVVETLAAPAPAAAQAPPVTTCNGGTLSAGTGGDLEVTGVCNVPAGTYRYRYVNVWGGGDLHFADAVIDFWASSILVESGGSLTAGTPTPIGTAGGRLTFHLYGGPTSDTNPPIACKSSATCGVDPAIWNGTVTTPVSLPGGVTDYFYGYGMNHGNDHGHLGMFGAKVLAVSYNGTLNLFGKKGGTYRSALPSDSGTSWVRLAKSVQKGARLLLVDRPVDWQAGDSIVLTTTDYLPGHSEKLTVLSVASNGKTVNVKEAIQYAPNGNDSRSSRPRARAL